jgi:hypothetical protein
MTPNAQVPRTKAGIEARDTGYRGFNIGELQVLLLTPEFPLCRRFSFAAGLLTSAGFVQSLVLLTSFC